MIIAGEASGDHHGARLVEAMRRKDENLFFCGIGGKSLEAAGARIVVDASTLSVVGITEVISKLPNLLKGMARVKKLLRGLQPDLLILIDFPDFNLHMASVAKSLEIPVLYYISPQIWAWRSGRIRKIKRVVDHMAVILPFEEAYYRKYQVPVTFVGHPLLDSDTIIPKQSGPFTADPSVIGILPGSRDTEVSRHLPDMLSAADRLTRRNRNLKFLVSLAPTVERAFLEKIVSSDCGKASCEIVTGGVNQVLERCGFAIVVSGTVSLETAISGTPMVIIYRVSPLSYWIGKALAKVGHIGLINLIAEKEIVPELIQDAASPEQIADKVYEMISDSAGLLKIKNDLAAATQMLGGPGASGRAAEVALGMLET